MPFFRVDDQIHSHPKVRRAGLAAMGLWALAGSYAMAYKTDGFVPEWWVKSYPQAYPQARRLVESGLWTPSESPEGEPGWQFHDWSDYQETRDQIEAKRERTRERTREWRKRLDDAKSQASSAKAAKTPGKRGSSASNGDAVGDAVSDAVTDASRDAVGDASRDALVTRPSPLPTPPPTEVSPSPPDGGSGTGTLVVLGLNSDLEPIAGDRGQVVAAWIDGWRETNPGHEPLKAVTRRVAGSVKQLTRDCHTRGDWNDAWRIAREAGRKGRVDLVGYAADRGKTIRSGSDKGNPGLAITEELRKAGL